MSEKRDINIRLLRALSFFAFLFLFAGTSDAIVYQYFDDEGALIVTNIPPGGKKPVHAPDEARGQETGQKPRAQYPDIRLDFSDDVDYDYYPVTAHTFQEAVMGTNMKGPFEARENKRYAAQTKWKVGWSYKLKSDYRLERPRVYVSPEIYDVQFRSDITVLLPALSEDSSLSEHDSMLWEKFVQGLLAHEHDHVALIRDPSYRDEAVRKMSGLGEMTLDYDPSVAVEDAIRSAVEAETAKIGHDLIREIKARNDEYDRLTEHGLKPEMRQVFFR
jgi:predicted secreted Zn-dependent protease